MEDFNIGTIDPNIFIIKDVKNDNSCLYRSLANTIHQRKKDNNIVDFVSEIDTDEEILCIESEIQETLARELQEISYKWVINNLYMEYPDLGITIEEMIMNCHEMSVEEYINNYKFFAGDIIVKKIKNGNKTITEFVPNRWGSLLELYCISNYYKIQICIYISQKYDIKREKIITGKIRNEKPEKGVRFRLSEIVGHEYSNMKPPLFILWRKTSEGPHYMSLFPKNELWIDEHKNLINKN